MSDYDYSAPSDTEFDDEVVTNEEVVIEKEEPDVFVDTEDTCNCLLLKSLLLRALAYVPTKVRKQMEEEIKHII